MGSWSVYCGVSKITIRAGDKCVLLPIKKSENIYTPYMPAVLPIYGVYNDYGSLEDIEEDENTKFIEVHFKCSIEDFVEYFTSCKESETELVQHQFEANFDEMKDWDFMFIDREVYDFLSSKCYGEIDVEMGNQDLLNYLGFTYIDKIENTRYCHEWTYEGKTFYSDGRWLHFNQKEGGPGIYHLTGGYEGSNLDEYITIPKDKHHLYGKDKAQLWQLHTTDNQVSLLYFILEAKDYYDYGKYIRIIEHRPELLEKINQIHSLYLKNVSTFGDELAKLIVVFKNMRNYSQTFEPYILYQTPQCGEFEVHSLILNKFLEINNSKIYIEYLIDE